MSVPAFTVVQGLVVGLNYGLLALGIVLIYRTSRVLNFAQGQLGVVGAAFLVKVYYDYGFSYWLALAIVLGLSAVVGGVSEIVLRRLFNRPRVMVMVATIGLSQVLFLFTLMPFVRPKHLFKPFPVPVHVSFHVGRFLFQPGQVLTLIVAPLVALALAAFIQLSPWGLAMRAMSENADSARLSGVWVRRTSTVAWTVAGVLSAVTAILNAPGQTTVLTQVLSPGLLLRALTSALIGGMVSLPVAFVAGIGIGVVEQVLVWNVTDTATIEAILFGLLLVVMLVRVGALQRGGGEERSSWNLASIARVVGVDRLRQRVGQAGVAASLALAAAVPAFAGAGRAFLLARICIFGVIAMSLTVLTGWGGQVSLGHFGLVAVGALVATHLGSSVPLVGLLVVGGALSAAVAVVVGLPALRIRGLYLAVTTLGFALFVQEAVLGVPCFGLPLLHRRACLGLPDPQSTLVSRPSLFGLSLGSQQAFAWLCLAVLVASVAMVRTWRDKGVARRLIAVRDNEVAAGAAGIPVTRTKLAAFALSGFMAGYAGVLFALATQRFSTDTFDPSVSILVVSMVVIGGLDSVAGALLGALYLVGLPAIFGTTPTVQFLTSGLGLMAFLLYLPGGLAQLLHQAGDLAASGVAWLLARWRARPPAEELPPGAAPAAVASPANQAPVGRVLP